MMLEPSLQEPRGSTRLSLAEVSALGLFVAVFFTVNILTADRSPTIAMDEVWLAEPSVNLAEGRGFTSNVSGFHGRTQFTPGATLYSLLLREWLRFVPFSPTGVRSLNYVLILVAGLILWRAAALHRWIVHPKIRLAFLAVLLMSHSITFCYRGGRYDVAGILVLSLVLLGAGSGIPWLRYSLIVVGGALVPIAGLQVLAYVGLMSLIIVTFSRSRYSSELASLWTGVVLGSYFFYVLHATHGATNQLLRIIGIRSLLPVAEVPPSAWSSSSAKLSRILHAFVDDPIIALFILCFLCLLIWSRRSGHLFTTAAMMGLAVAVGIPFSMALLYDFPVYYGWMVYVPALLILFFVYERLPSTDSMMRNSIALVAVVVASTGLPLRLGLTAVEWKQRDYGPVQSLVEAHVRPGDRVFADFTAFYPLRKVADDVFYPPYLYQLTSVEKERMTLLVVRPEQAEEVRQVIGGEWQIMDGLRAPPFTGVLASIRKRHGAQLYSLDVYRRVGG